MNEQKLTRGPWVKATDEQGSLITGLGMVGVPILANLMLARTEQVERRADKGPG